MLDLVKVATVLEAAADHFDALEAEKTSTVRAERVSHIDKLAETYAQATGEEMPDNVRRKLAESDQDVVGLLKSIVEKQAGTVDPLGGPSNHGDSAEPKTVKEAAAAAEDRFAAWITS